MNLSQELPIAAPPERVWALVENIAALAGCIPGCRECQSLGPDGKYKATVVERVGPFQLQVPLDIAVTDVQPPSSLRVQATGKDARLGSTVSLEIRVEIQPAEGRSVLLIQSETRVMGKLATLGMGMIQRKAEEILAAFAANIRRQLEVG